jgi:hypothetical protein
MKISMVFDSTCLKFILSSLGSLDISTWQTLFFYSRVILEDPYFVVHHYSFSKSRFFKHSCWKAEQITFSLCLFASAISQLYFGTYLLHVSFLCYTMNSYSTVTTKHISQFFYIWISTDVRCLPVHPSFILPRGGL